MGKLKRGDRDRIRELWAGARERLARIAESAAEYFEQPEHDQELVDTIREALDEAHNLKMQGLHHFPPYVPAPGSPPLLAPHLYDLLERIRSILVGLGAPLLVQKFDRDKLRREIADVVAAVDATTAGTWTDPECQRRWRHLHATLLALDAVVLQIDSEVELRHSPSGQVAHQFGQQVARALEEALVCLSGSFPYLDLIRKAKEVDLYLWAIGFELATLLEPPFDIYGDPRSIRDTAYRVGELLDELESKLETAPVEGQ